MPAALNLTLEFVRTRDPADPYAMQLGRQEYLVRDPSRLEYDPVSMDWDDGMLGLLGRLVTPGAPPSVTHEVGQRLHRFLAPAGWRAYEEQITQAMREGRPVRITVVSGAAELYALPWELLTLRATGQQLGRLPDCLVSYAWPGSAARSARRDEPARVVIAWSAAGGPVPAAEHIVAVERAAGEGKLVFDHDTDVVPNASLRAIDRRFRQANDRPAILHLLCHGSPEGLALQGADAAERVLVDSVQIQTLLAPYVNTLRLVVLCACHGGDATAFGSHAGSAAQALHRAGIPAVVASRFPLSVGGSVALARELYGALSHAPGEIDDAVLSARRTLALEPGGTDHLALQLYAHRGAPWIGRSLEKQAEQVPEPAPPRRATPPRPVRVKPLDLIGSAEREPAADMDSDHHTLWKTLESDQPGEAFVGLPPPAEDVPTRHVAALPKQPEATSPAQAVEAPFVSSAPVSPGAFTEVPHVQPGSTKPEPDVVSSPAPSESTTTALQTPPEPPAAAPPRRAPEVLRAGSEAENVAPARIREPSVTPLPLAVVPVGWPAAAEVDQTEVWPPPGWPTCAASLIFPFASSYLFGVVPVMWVGAPSLLTETLLWSADIVAWGLLALAGCSTVMDRPRSLARSLAAACALSFTHLLAMFMVWFNACPECTLATSNVGIALIAAMATPWFALSLGRLGFHPDARGLWKGVLVGTLGAGAIFAPLVAIGDLIGEGVVLASMVVLGGAWVGWTSRQALESRWHLTTGAVLLQVLFISMCFFGAGGQDAGGVLLLPFLAFSGWILWRSRLRPSEVVLDDAA